MRLNKPKLLILHVYLQHCKEMTNSCDYTLRFLDEKIH